MSGKDSWDQTFTVFSKMGNQDGKRIKLEQIDKWLTDAKVMGKKMTTKDTKACFEQFKSDTINSQEFKKFLDDLAKRTNTTVEEVNAQLASSQVLADAQKMWEELQKQMAVAAQQVASGLQKKS